MRSMCVWKVRGLRRDCDVWKSYRDGMRGRGGGGGGRWVDEPQLLGRGRRRSLRLTRGPAFRRGGLRLRGALLGAHLLRLLGIHDIAVALLRLG